MLYYILSIVLVVIDQIVKIWVRSAIPLGQSIPFIPYLMDLTYTQNTGAAFSSVAYLMWKNFFPGKWGKLSLSLILAGAVGNLIDRALLGYVTDMFETTFMNFAVFNVADICVVVGGFLMVFYALFLWDKDKEPPHDAP